MNNKLYLNISSGISGDMFLALLINLGADSDKLSQIISRILGKDVGIYNETLFRNGIKCARLVIEANIEGEPFRHFSMIKSMIESSTDLSPKVKEKSVAAFRIIAEAESWVHNSTIEEVHFHEIGAVDTIIDIVGAAWCLEELGITEVVSTPALCGKGTVKTCHGLLPLPAPATLKILENMPLQIIDVQGELTTPTGAAIMKAFVSKYDEPSSITITQSAYSTGNLEFKGVPNMLRGFIFCENEATYNDTVLSITANIDDMTGEAFGLFMDKLHQVDGVLDVCYTPAFGKKSRPLYILNLLLEIKAQDDAIATIFKHSSTAGFRLREEKRLIMERCFVETEVWGEKIKVKHLSYKTINKFYPEWEDCVKAGNKTGKTVHEIYSQATSQVNS